VPISHSIRDWLFGCSQVKPRIKLLANGVGSSKMIQKKHDERRRYF